MTDEQKWDAQPSEWFTSHTLKTNGDWHVIMEAEAAILNLLQPAAESAALDICATYPEGDHISKLHDIKQAAAVAYELALLQKNHTKTKRKD